MSDIENDEAASKALTPIPAKETGVYQAEIGVAQLMAKSSLLPKHLHGNPGNCLAVLMLSRDWNMNPIAVGLKTSVIPKKSGGETLMFEGQLVNAVIAKSKVVEGRLRFDLEGKGETTICTATGRIRGESDERTVTIGMPKTRNSPLWSGNQGDIEQQMTYLAARTWCRRHAPEILLGVYTPEDDWTERDPDAYSGRREQVGHRVAVLEHAPSAGTGIPVADRDDFIEGEKVAVVTGNKSNFERAIDDHIADQRGQISTNPEDRKPPEDDLDAPIPDFGAKNVSCGTCGGKGSVEFKGPDGEGIEPCPDCSLKKS